MELQDHSTGRKALLVNLNDEIYGTFAEIGAGQEVVRHFFQAGRASHTIAKTISAYDMTFSDAIYGRGDRYVSEPRLMKMLDHEYSLLKERLAAQRGANTRFFAFANTVTTSSRTRGQSPSHGWMGIRFQLTPGGPHNDIILHVRLWDQFRLQQTEALGRLGVNLIYNAFHQKDPVEFIKTLQDNIEAKRIEIDLLRFAGEDFKHIDNRISSLELVRQHLTEAIMFDSNGQVQLASEMLYAKPVLVLRGAFRPVTNTNLEIIQKGTDQFVMDGANKETMKVLFEMTMSSFLAEGQLDKEDFLNRVDTLAALGHPVMVTNFLLFHELKSYLRTCTKDRIGLVIGASHLEKLMDESFYTESSGGILEAFSRLFDKGTEVLVFPFKTDQICLTASNFNPQPHMSPLYQYLHKNNMIRDISNCDGVNTSIHSGVVREMLQKNQPGWEKLVPSAVSNLIKTKKLFGYNPK